MPFPIQYIRKAYCWQVAPRQSLFPLELYIFEIKKLSYGFLKNNTL